MTLFSTINTQTSCIILMSDHQHCTAKRARLEHKASSNKNASFPTRDCRNLWVSDRTLNCASSQRCVPCAYKICCFDVALDEEFCRIVPNQRPELCPRSNRNSYDAYTEILGYGPGLKVLTVGDGDFSFSLALARLGVTLTATSYESRRTVETVYPHIEKTLKELESLGVSIFFQVDATNLASTLPLSSDSNVKFDRIIWNFPCSAICKGQDGQNKEMELNKDLVRRFLKSAASFASPRCQIHMNHKTKPPFNQWRIEDVARELEDANGNVYHHVGRIVLDRCLLHPYIPRKALDRRSFPVHDACTYVFSLQPADMPTACAATAEAKLVPVTREVIQSIRDLHVTLHHKRRHK
ncbi:hypothetical protein MPSEU_000496400 [Mayamaea pseudoterrestris]|nr:hypothetical protein MPSEU_000495300 [Mayamaea pseudoterrestris]GKY95346.1 hypothetical protein MPSEU_000496400 [Mayamaea pseudoterrestris]